MRKRCVRRVWAKVNTIEYAIQGVAIPGDAELSATRLRELAAVEAFRTGEATLQEWNDINALCAVCETMARGGIGPEALEAVARVEATLIDAAKRFEATGKMGITGEGLRAFRDLYAFHDLQRTSISRGEYERWIRKTGDIVRGGGKTVKELA